MYQDFINITDFGAVGDGKTINTRSIQEAIDLASAKQGTVYIPAGLFMTGSLNLKNASLYLERDAVLKGSPDLADYPFIGYYHNEMHEVTSLLYSMNQKHIHIFGFGTIDFNGNAFYDTNTPVIPPYYKTPLSPEQILECNYYYTDETRVNQPCFFLNVEDLTIDGITLLNSSCWTVSLCHCKNVKITNVTISTSHNIPNNDGIHISCSDGVIISNCHISSGDDCIAMTTTTKWDDVCQNIVISDCVLSSCSKAIDIGYLYSHIRNVTISNCTIQDSNRGLCIMVCEEEGLIENVTVNNLVISTKIHAGTWWGNGEPILIFGMQHDNAAVSHMNSQRTNRRWKDTMKNIIINNVICYGENAIGIVGTGNNVNNITLSNIYFNSRESANISLKGRVLDTLPSPYFIGVPEDCFLQIVGSDGVNLINVNGDDKSGVNQIYSVPYNEQIFIPTGFPIQNPQN
ncbi:MAG: glycoside hydrolase family 28 protein [Oliverpabstia sp.]